MRLRNLFLCLFIALSIPIEIVHAQNNWILAPQINNASDIVITSATTTTLTFNWTDGNQANRIVVMKSGSAVDSNPVNGVSYTASLTFGSGTQIGTGNYVVRIGSGPITVTGLTQGVIYYITVYEFNGSGGNESYLTTNPATGFGAATSTEYQAVLTYATSQGWTLPSVPQQQIASIYVSRLVTSGLWAKKRVIWIFATDGDRNFAKINYKDPGNFTCTEVGTPTFTTNGGFSSADLASYLDTGWKPVTNAGGLYAQNSAHLTAHISGITAVLNNNYVDFGNAGASNNNAIYSQCGMANTNWNIRFNSSTTHGQPYDGFDWGYFLAERRTASSNTLFRQREFVKDNLSSTSTSLTDINLYVCAYNANGTAAAHSPRIVGTLQLGTELGDASAFDDAEYWRDYYQSITGANRPVNHGPFTTYESRLNIIATRDNYQFASDGYNLRWSDDWGATWTIYPFGKAFQYGGTATEQFNKDYSVTGAHIFATGTLLFSTATKMYRSTDGLATTPTTIVPKNTAGSDYTIHTPSNAARPGNYFGSPYIEPVPSTLTSGDEIVVWGTYSNVTQGAAPTNIWYSIDDGVTVKAAYEFGQNTNYRDDGTDDGGTTGTLLGNAGSSIIIRHVHSTVRNPGTLDWYICTGDASGTPAEILWLSMTYNEGADTWGSPSVLYTAPSANEWKSVDIIFDGSDLYFASDGGGTTGVYRTTIANIGVIASATRVLATALAIGGFRFNPSGGFMMVLPLDNYMLVAQNFGSTYFNYPITGADVATCRLLGFSNKDSRGYYKFNVSGGSYNATKKTVWIKEN